MRIRTMDFGDLEQIAELEAACFRQSWSKAMLEESLKNACNVFLGAEEDGQFIAYAIVSVIAGEAELLRIAVRQGFRHRGIGRKLLEVVEASARQRGAKVLLLEVRESNRAARKLYIYAGFQEEGRRKNYYSQPQEDAIMMAKRAL